MPYIKLAAVALVSLAALLFGTGIERIVWMFSRGGLVADLPKSIYKNIPDIACERPSVEVKRDPDGVLRYRCGTYWLLSSEQRSPALTAEWRKVVADLRAKGNSHP